MPAKGVRPLAPRLTLAEVFLRGAQPPSEHSLVQTWLTPRGRHVASGFRHDDSCWMVWPGVAGYRFRWPDESAITAYPAPGARRDVVWDTYRRSVLPMAMQASGWEALHASAVVSGEGVVVFCAVSRTGKSTLAYGLRARGFPQWADDGVILADMEGMKSVPMPFEVRLRSDARDVLGSSESALPRHSRFEDNGLGEQQHTSPLPIKALCVLRRDDSLSRTIAGRITPLTPADAFTAVLTHAHEFDPTDQARRALMVRTYLQLVADVPTFEIAFGSRSRRIDGLLDLVIGRLQIQAPRALVEAQVVEA